MTVNNIIHKTESKIWHTLEGVTSNHPTASKIVLPLPLAIATLARDILLSPAKVVEELYLLGEATINYYREKDEKKAYYILHISIEKHILYSITNTIAIFLYPIVGLLHAIRILVQTIISPIKIAKTQASKCDLQGFLKEEKIVKMSMKSNGEATTFACTHKYAKHAFKRFVKKVASTNESEVKNLHFVDTLESRNLLVTELNAKNRIMDAAEKVYSANFPKEQKDRPNYYKQYEEFQTKLLNVDLPNVESTSFNPQIEIL